MKKPFYGWIIVGVAFLIGVTEAGAFQPILSIFMIPMANEFGWSRTAISGSIAVGSICGGIISPFVGPLIDRHGPRVTAFLGILLLSLGLVCMTIVGQVWQLYLFIGIGRMVAVGILGMAISVSVSNWFIQKRGRAMGVVWLGPRFGAAVLPLLAQFFILDLGWRLAWGSLGLTVFLLSGLPVLMFLRHKPEDMGLLPDGATDLLEENNASKADRMGAPDPDTDYDRSLNRSQAIRTPAFWMLTIIHSLFPFIQAGISFHLYPFMIDHGILPVVAVMALTINNITGAFGSLGWGMLAEKSKVQYLLSLNFIISSFIFLSIYWTVVFKISGDGMILLLLLLVAFNGVTFGGRHPLFSIIWADFFGRKSIGSIMGFASPFRLGANAVGPIFAALFHDFYGNYAFPFYLFASGYFLTGIICLTVKPPLTFKH